MTVLHPVSLIGGPRSGTVEYVEEPWPRQGYIHVDDGLPGNTTAKYDPRKVSSSPEVWEAVYVEPGSEVVDDEQSTEGEPGPTGPAGPAGVPGPQGPPGDDGAIYTYRGSWGSSVPYSEGDVVSYGGGSYVATTNVIGTAPPGAPWGQLAAKGADGAGATDTDKNYVHTQSTAATTWSVAHNLGKYPSVTVLDSVREELEAEVDHVDVNNLTVKFSGAMSGSASLN